MQVIRRGAAGHKVKFLQRLLNKAMASDRVTERALRLDGSFGERTEAAVLAFQHRHPPLVADGIVGNNTWHTLGVQAEQEHPVTLFGQPTTMTCWSAAATMIFGNDRSVSPGEATLTATGSLTRSLDNVRAFADSLGWEMLDHSPDVNELVQIVMRTPVWIAVHGSGWGHAAVLSGVYSDNSPAGDGTMFRIHDPWPQGQGRVYGSFADPIMILGNDNVTWMPASLESVLDPRP